MSSAMAALSSSARLGTNAASSITTRPCMPRSAVGRDGSPTILPPDANVRRKALMSPSSSSITTSSTAAAASPKRSAHSAQVSTNSRVMSLL